MTASEFKEPKPQEIKYSASLQNSVAVGDGNWLATPNHENPTVVTLLKLPDLKDKIEIKCSGNVSQIVPLAHDQLGQFAVVTTDGKVSVYQPPEEKQIKGPYSLFSENITIDTNTPIQVAPFGAKLTAIARNEKQEQHQVRPSANYYHHVVFDPKTGISQTIQTKTSKLFSLSGSPKSNCLAVVDSKQDDFLFVKYGKPKEHLFLYTSDEGRQKFDFGVDKLRKVWMLPNKKDNPNFVTLKTTPEKNTFLFVLEKTDSRIANLESIKPLGKYHGAIISASQLPDGNFAFFSGSTENPILTLYNPSRDGFIKYDGIPFGRIIPTRAGIGICPDNDPNKIIIYDPKYLKLDVARWEAAFGESSKVRATHTYALFPGQTPQEATEEPSSSSKVLTPHGPKDKDD